MVELRCQPYESRVHKTLLSETGARKSARQVLRLQEISNYRNRRIRNRTYGGVRERRNKLSFALYSIGYMPGFKTPAISAKPGLFSFLPGIWQTGRSTRGW